jgi:transposase
MQVKTLLNRVHKVKGFVYERVQFRASKDMAIEVAIRPRRGSRPFCSGCGRRAKTYDRLAARAFTFVPLWAISVLMIYAPRRVNCRACGVKIELLPWTKGKKRITNAHALFLARWARRLSWKEVATIFQTSWDTVYRSVEEAVEYGLKHRELEDVSAVGVDEIQFQKGHRYLTLVYQIDQSCRRLLWIGQDRTAKSFLRFFRMMGKRRTTAIRFVCSDMWPPYLKVIRKKVPHAIHILDRFHIVARLNKAVDEVRAAEVKELAREGYDPVLKHSRWCLLKRPENLTDKQGATLRDLMRFNLKSIRAYLLKDSFQALWDYKSYHWAGRFLDGWIRRAMRSRLAPIKTVARSLRTHRGLILNWFAAKKEYSSGIVEGLNNKVKLTIRKAYGFRELRAAEVALYHALGKLPEPKLDHRFC